MKRVLLVVVLVAAVACTGSSAAPAPSGPCGLRLPPPQLGQPRFAVPEGGQAVERLLARGFALCAVHRRDGSLFARLHRDREGRILAVAFFWPGGTLRASVSATYAVAERSRVSCSSSKKWASLGEHSWTKTREWWIGATAPGLERGAVEAAVKNAQSQWTNNVNWCGIADAAKQPMTYKGKTSTAVKNDKKSVVDWGKLKDDQSCYQALACTATWYDGQGRPIESDIRFNTAFKWATDGRSNAYDIRSVAAHEIGHVLQFDHVSSDADEAALMWPYLAEGDTSGRKLGRGDALGNNSRY